MKSKVKEYKKENLFVRLPDGRIIRFKRYLYGLKQAGYEWQTNATTVLEKHGYKPTADPLVFVKRPVDDIDEFILMSLHVDDFYVVSTKHEFMDELYELLLAEYGEVTKKSGDIL